MEHSVVLRQFLLLLWKNYILQIRRPVGTVIELILPTVIILLIISLRHSDLFPSKDHCFLTFEPDSLDVPQSFDDPYSIYFTPNNSATNEIVDRSVMRLGVRVTTIGFDNEDDMVKGLAATNRSQSQTCFSHGAGIVFNNLDGPSVEYTLRLRHEVGSDNSWETASRGPSIQLPGSRVSPNFYLEEGFLHLQDAVGQSIIEFLANKTINIQVSVQQFPYPPYRVDYFLQAVGAFLPLLIIIAFLFSAGIFVKELVLEKESRIRETMLMMGLKQWTLWSTWYLKQFIFFMISVMIICILVKVGQVFPKSDFSLLVIFFSIFSLSMISFCFLVSVWFNSARIGLIAGFLAWFMNYFPFVFILLRYDNLPLFTKVGSCLLSNTCLGLGVEVISRLEQRLEGLQWDNIATPLSADDGLNMAWVLGMLLIDSFIYMIFSLYINGVKPGQYGVPKPFYFPCLPSYWSGAPRRSEIVEPKLTEDNNSSSNHEEVADDLNVGISIRNLTKVYGQSLFDRLFSNKNKKKPRKKAVDNITLNMYEGQITALLGHNGAGKTTTMSILTGLYTPTSGGAIINGFNILTDMDQIRKSLGICPQHNILFDRLTVSEHLSFFIRLKGVFHKDCVCDEVKTMVADLQLGDKASLQANHLSGGMKRKLSVAIALIGGSKVVILDEPTSGMDPYARRATWDLLAKHKSGRTMLLTTHHMDEADLLGDRIAIMAEGKLCCSGSSLFLKSKYGIGYHMTVVKKSSCDSSKIEKLMKSLVPKAKQVTDVGAELSYILPSSATPLFPKLFDRLETERKALGIVSFGVSVTTMEEVFMKVGEGATDDMPNDRLHQGDGMLSSAWSQRPTQTTPDTIPNMDITLSLDHNIMESDISNSDIHVGTLDVSRDEFSVSPIHEEAFTPFSTATVESIHNPNATNSTNVKPNLSYHFTPNTGRQLWSQQFWAMFLKRFYHSLRFYAAVISQILFPVLFVSLGMVLAITVPGRDQDDSKRVLNLDNSALFTDNLSIFYAQFGDIDINNKMLILSELEAANLGVKNILDFTSEILHIKNETSSVSDNISPSDCCTYRYQLLDQFCASRSYQLLSGICSGQSGFGYSSCSHCLRCCQSTTESQNILKSCTNPLSLVFPFNNLTSGEFCPAPPKLSYSSLQKSIPRGPLESDNIYIAEYLLQTADSLKPDVFFRRFQGGFSLSYNEPSYSICGCNSTQDVCDFFTPLRASSDGQCPRYSIDQQCALSWAACYAIPQSCKAIQDNCRLLGSRPDSSTKQVSTTLKTCRTLKEDYGLLVNNMSLPGIEDTSSSSTVDKPLSEILQSYRALIDNCSLLENSSDGGIKGNESPSNASSINSLLADITQSCKNLMSDCKVVENTPDLGISINCSDINSTLNSHRFIVQFCNTTMKDCSLLIYVSDASEQTPSSYSSTADVLFSGGEQLSNCSTVDGLSADILQYGACGRLGTVEPACPVQEQIVGAVYPDRDRQIEATIWYNNQPFHMPAAALNAFHNVLLKSVTGDNPLSITVNNHPLPRSIASLQIINAVSDPTGFGISVLIVFGYSFLLASFVLFLVKEKESKAKHLQFVSGVHSSSYWLATFAWDLLNALVPIIISIIIFAAFRVDAFSSPEALATIFVLLLLSIWSSIPLTYVASFMFSNSITAYSLLMVFFFFSSVLPQTVVLVIQSIGGDKDIVNIFTYVFLVFPTFGLSSALNDIYINHILKGLCQSEEIRMFCENNDAFDFADSLLEFHKPGVGLIFLYMSVEGIVFFIITLVIQENFFMKAIFHTSESITESSTASSDDNDVRAEAQRVLSGNINEDDVIIVKNLVKVYSPHLSGCKMKPAKRAVDGISLAIPVGECFGLLGVNGAGKTTTFSILTGDSSMTSGTAIIAGYDIRTHLRKVQQRIGYCPQFDALIEHMTGRELLTMFARLRGVPEKQINEVVETEITRLDLKKYADKSCGNYSGGNKRKLSTAIALVGNPPIILLDEPTTGMDPATRRYLWNVLTGITKEGRSIILTSHSMEECEALCTRLAIMVNGSFKCLGSIQHLKNKFGSGLTLQIKVKLSPPPKNVAFKVPSKRFSFHSSLRDRSPVDGEEGQENLSISGEVTAGEVGTSALDSTSLHSFIHGAFPNAVLMEEHQGTVTYHLPKADLSWSSVFRHIENNKDCLGIVDYSVSQTTLEQVFVTFAKLNKTE